jgi:leucyl aminopeptidase
MQIELKKSSLDNLGVDTLIVFVSKKNEEKKPHSGKTKAEASTLKSASAKATVEGVTKSIQTKIQNAAEEGSIAGACQETVLFRDAQLGGARHLLTVGLGDIKSLTHETLRQAAASATHVLKQTKFKTAAIALDSLPHNDLSADVMVQALTEGALLGDYQYTEFKHDKAQAKSPIENLQLISSHKVKTHERGLEAGTIISECVNFARWMGDRPGNKMTPTIMAEETMKAAKGTKLKVNVWDRSRIKSEKMGSFLGVAQGSTQEPRFILMEYNGASKSKRPICFVGKGLTFDTGGVSLKPGAGMEEMKFDMCGGAAVIATMLAIAKLKLKVNAIAFVPATENMPGSNAIKPGDVVIARNGKSIEVNNTDAEGRLILADALVYACEQKPSMIVDVATLTGAMAVALGNLHTGFFSRNEKLVGKIKHAAEASGEWVWHMPLTDMHVRDMKGHYADLNNISSGKGAGSATAAAFLEQFVEKDIPWAHFDIAGTAWHTGDRLPHCPRKGASGVMVRTFVQLAMMED